MLAVERRSGILRQVQREGRVVVTEVSRAFGVTEETVRRDLNQLEREGLLSRTHGGAVARRGEAEDLPYGLRNQTNLEAKRAIGARAAELVRDGDALMLNSSSTAYEALRALHAHRDLTLITNSVRLLADPELTSHTIMSVGGELRRRSMTFVGPIAAQAIGQFNADAALISCKALSPSRRDHGGQRRRRRGEARLHRQAAPGLLLADGDKFDQTALVTICGFGPIDVIVTDRRPATPGCGFSSGNR